ncbi:MAG TPA: hypothetical protein VM367_00740 [Pseudonocardia sp.]|nr:hypothetical protein [Pseudonocardia sp.]
MTVAPSPGRTERANGLRADLVTVAAAVVLVVAAAAVGRVLTAAGYQLFLGFPPLLATWRPHVGPGTPVALAVAVLVVARGPAVADRLRWGPLLVLAYAASLAWTVGLALVDGWTRGVVWRLTSVHEYLVDVPRVTDVAAMLQGFAERIPTDHPERWATHVGAHPPGALLVFVWLDRLGLGGGGASGVAVMVVGASACVAVAVTLRALGHEDVARRVLPFGVLLPGAVWVGVSADGLFAAVLAWGVALLTVGTRGRGPRGDLAAASGGVLLGFALYLSYGLVLGGLVPLAVLAATRSLRAAALGTAGVLAVVATFTVAGFWWFDGFGHLRVVYAASAAAGRPYGYFVWANLAAVAFALGPAALAALRRAAAAPRTLPRPALLLALAGVAAIALADLSGLSKAEVERIWLPFVVWVVVACATLPRAHVRGWLAAQAGLALAVNHLLLTVW